MRTLMLTVSLSFAVIAAGGPGAVAQDLFPTPTGRLGGREELPTPGPAMLTPTPAMPTPTPPVSPTPPPSAGATPQATDTARPTAEVVLLPAIEAGALEAVRAATVTVVAERVGGAFLGTGWVFDADGRIVTAAPLVEGADRVAVVAVDGRRLEATLVGADPLSGVAVLEAPGGGLSPVPLGGEAVPGRSVVAVGTADGRFPGTLVGGEVSSARRSLPERYPATHLVLTAMTLPDGMAGGPLVDEATGAAVGLLVPGPNPETAGFEPPIVGGGGPIPSGVEGLAFAVPSETVGRVVEELIANGRVRYPYLGAALAPVDPVSAARLDLPNVGGTVVEDVAPDGPAARAGIEPGDVIVGVDGAAVGPDLPIGVALAALAPGAEVRLDLMRDGRSIEIRVVLGERPEGS